jgi:hypothetical protein
LFSLIFISFNSPWFNISFSSSENNTHAIMNDIVYIYIIWKLQTSRRRHLRYANEQSTHHFWLWGACQYSNESARTSLNIDTPLHCKSDTKCHVFCKWFVEWSNGMSPHIRSLVHGTESLRWHTIQTSVGISRSWIHFII